MSRRPDHQPSNSDSKDNIVNDSTDVIRRAIQVSSIAETTTAITPYSNLFGISTFTVGDDYLDNVKQAYNDDEICKSITQSNGTPMVQYRTVLYIKVTGYTYHHMIA